MKAWCIKTGSHNLQVMRHAGEPHTHTGADYYLHIQIHHKLTTAQRHVLVTIG